MTDDDNSPFDNPTFDKYYAKHRKKIIRLIRIEKTKEILALIGIFAVTGSLAFIVTHFALKYW